MIFANVIWAPNWPFWYAWLPVSALIGFIAEWLTFHFYQRRCHPIRRSLLLVAVANVASFFVGFIGLALIAGALPDRSFMAPEPLGFPPWQRYQVILWQFLAAYFLSVCIELIVYRLLSRHRTLHRLPAAVFMSNLVSYAVISVGYIFLWLPSFQTPDEWLHSFFQRS